MRDGQLLRCSGLAIWLPGSRQRFRRSTKRSPARLCTKHFLSRLRSEPWRRYRRQREAPDIAIVLSGRRLQWMTVYLETPACSLTLAGKLGGFFLEKSRRFHIVVHLRRIVKAPIPPTAVVISADELMRIKVMCDDFAAICSRGCSSHPIRLVHVERSRN